MEGELPFSPFVNRIKDDFFRLLKQYQEEPIENLENHIQKSKQKIWKEIQGFHRIYLDINIWISLREVALGRSKDENNRYLLHKLMQLAGEGKIICPLSDIQFNELMKQKDPRTREVTAELMDVLCKGIALSSFDQRASQEIIYWIAQYLPAKDVWPNPVEVVWTKVAYLLGDYYPRDIQLPISYKDKLAWQNAFYDILGEATLLETLRQLGNEGYAEMPKMPDLTQSLNDGKHENQTINDSFDKLYLDEMIGCVDGMWSSIYMAFSEMYKVLTGSSPSATEYQISDEVKIMMRNNVAHVIKTKKIGKYLPSFQIQAGGHAAIRIDLKRKYKKGDLLDLNHAAAALPYCHVFVTDNSMYSLLTTKPLEYDNRFTAKIIRADKLIDYLDRL